MATNVDDLEDKVRQRMSDRGIRDDKRLPDDLIAFASEKGLRTPERGSLAKAVTRFFAGGAQYDLIFDLLCNYAGIAEEERYKYRRAHRRLKAKSDSQKSINKTNVELARQFFPSTGQSELQDKIKVCAHNATSFIHYLTLCNTVRRGSAAPDFSYHPTLLQDEELISKIRNGISFLRVEVFFEKQRFIEALRMSHRLRDCSEYECKYYMKPPNSIPTINFISFDDEVFEFGGFHQRRDHQEFSIFVSENDLISKFFSRYWTELWSNAIDLYDSNLTQAFCIAKSLGIESEWEAIKREILDNS